MSGFNPSQNQEKAIISLGGGDKPEKAADIAGVSERTIYRWLENPEFKAMVDEITVKSELATVGGRLRVAYRVAQGRMLNSIPKSDKDLLDWLKYIQTEMEPTQATGRKDDPIQHQVLISYDD